MSACSSCGAEIIWCLTEKGKRIPMDAEPVADGNMIIVNHVARVPRLGDDIPFLMHKSHFATCIHADQHRGKGARKLPH